MKWTRKMVEIKNLHMVSWANDRPTKLCQRAIMREARRMRSSLTSRRSRTIRATRSTDRSSEPSPPVRVSMSKGITETKSSVNHVRK